MRRRLRTALVRGHTCASFAGFLGPSGMFQAASGPRCARPRSLRALGGTPESGGLAPESAENVQGPKGCGLPRALRFWQYLRTAVRQRSRALDMSLATSRLLAREKKPYVLRGETPQSAPGVKSRVMRRVCGRLRSNQNAYLTQWTPWRARTESPGAGIAQLFAKWNRRALGGTHESGGLAPESAENVQGPKGCGLPRALRFWQCLHTTVRQRSRALDMSARNLALARTREKTQGAERSNPSKCSRSQIEGYEASFRASALKPRRLPYPVDPMEGTDRVTRRWHRPTFRKVESSSTWRYSRIWGPCP